MLAALAVWQIFAESVVSSGLIEIPFGFQLK